VCPRCAFGVSESATRRGGGWEAEGRDTIDPVILTIAEMRIRAGCEGAFVAAARDAIGHILASPGCRSATLTRSVEDPCRYLVITEWDSLEAHTQRFYHSEHLANWRTAVSDYFDEPPMVEHVSEVLDTRGES
jgi:heme-degrading monooxygenase HmoA